MTVVRGLSLLHLSLRKNNYQENKVMQILQCASLKNEKINVFLVQNFDRNAKYPFITQTGPILPIYSLVILVTHSFSNY